MVEVDLGELITAKFRCLVNYLIAYNFMAMCKSAYESRQSKKKYSSVLGSVHVENALHTPTVKR